MLSKRLESGLSAEELHIILCKVIIRKIRLSYRHKAERTYSQYNYKRKKYSITNITIR